MVVTTGAIRRAKLQSKCHHQTPSYLQAGCHSFSPANSVKAQCNECTLNNVRISDIHLPGNHTSNTVDAMYLIEHVLEVVLGADPRCHSVTEEYEITHNSIWVHVDH